MRFQKSASSFFYAAKNLVNFEITINIVMRTKVLHSFYKIICLKLYIPTSIFIFMGHTNQPLKKMYVYKITLCCAMCLTGTLCINA